METLREIRKLKKLTQIDVAKALKVGQSTVATWESGIGYPRTDKLLELSVLLGVSVEDVIKAIGASK